MMKKANKPIKIINKTKNGTVFKCSTCNLIHIEYKNLNFNFTQEHYDHFINFILELNGKYWEERNQNTYYYRKIIIPIGHNNFNVMLNKHELNELKQLLSIKEKKSFNLFEYNISNN